MNTISASKLNLFLECPKCYWLQEVKKISRPRGIIASLMGGMDRVIKDWYDNHRPTLPIEVQGAIEGTLYPDLNKLKQWRNWRSGLSCIVDNRVKLIGALDDLIVQGEADSTLHIPFDIKTKGYEPKTDGSEYYQNQLDCYSLLLSSNGMKAADFSYLAYYHPFNTNGFDVSQDVIGIYFKVKVFKLETNPKRAKETILKALDCLSGPEPTETPGCEYCRYRGN